MGCLRTTEFRKNYQQFIDPNPLENICAACENPNTDTTLHTIIECTNSSEVRQDLYIPKIHNTHHIPFQMRDLPYLTQKFLTMESNINKLPNMHIMGKILQHHTNSIIFNQGNNIKTTSKKQKNLKKMCLRAQIPNGGRSDLGVHHPTVSR